MPSTRWPTRLPPIVGKPHQRSTLDGAIGWGWVNAPPCLGALSSLSLEYEPHNCLPRVEIIACSRCSINVDELNKTGAENDSYLGKTLLASNIARKMPFETDFVLGRNLP